MDFNMEADIVSNAVELQLLEEHYTHVVTGDNPLETPLLYRELDQLEMQGLYRDFFSLWEIAEYKFKQGLVFYRLALVTGNPHHLAKAIDFFQFVLYSNYRTRTCSTALLEWLIHKSSDP